MFMKRVRREGRKGEEQKLMAKHANGGQAQSVSYTKCGIRKVSVCTISVYGKVYTIVGLALLGRFPPS